MILYIINSFPFLKTRYLSILLVARFTFNLEKFTSQHFDEHTGEAHHLVGWEIAVRFLFFLFTFLSSLFLFFFLNHNDPSASTTRIQPFLSKFRFFRDKLSEGSSN